jgi:SAM-dependent methyltransferase
MNQSAPDGWSASAAAWIREMGEDGDYARRFVLDPAMLERIRGREFETALDVGCGEGRFCRIMQSLGLRTVGIDPTEALIGRARQLDPTGEYRIAGAESLDVAPASFDLVVAYLSLIDIRDLAGAVAMMVKALRPGGTLLIANLTSFNTAGMPDGWSEDPDGSTRFCIDDYLTERAVWVAWRGIRVLNWHRPLEAYVSLFLNSGLELRHFSEPAPVGGDPQRAERYRRVPWFLIMEWQKPRIAK